MTPFTGSSQAYARLGGAGAVLRSVQEKLAEFVSPKDFGAKGDGVTDDTPFIASAITWMTTVSISGGGTLKFPAGVYLIKPTSTTQVLPFGSNMHITGDGMGISVIRVAAGSGSYNSIFGSRFSVLSNVQFSNITIDQNDLNNPQTSGGDALAHSRFLISTAAGSAGLVLDQVEGINLNCINFVQSNSILTVIDNCRFLNIGGGTVPHDSSILYIQAEGTLIRGNVFTSRSLGAAGAVTAIETHGGGHIVTGNYWDGMMIGANITGVAANDSRCIVVANNIGKNGYYGIFCWSYQEPWLIGTTYPAAHLVSYSGKRYQSLTTTTGNQPDTSPTQWGTPIGTYGLDNLKVSGNSLQITQTAWTVNAGSGGSMLGNPFGVALYPVSNLPFRQIEISDNQVEFDLEPNNSYPWDSSGFGIGYWDSTNLNRVDGLKIAGNTVRNSPGPGIRFAANGNNIEIDGSNQLINCGSSLNAAAPNSFRCGVFLASQAHIPGLRLLDNSIVDNLATTRMVYGVEFATSNVGDILSKGNTIAVTGATATAFLGPWIMSVAGQVPLIQDTVYAPNAGNIFPASGLVALDSTITNLSAHVTYRVRANGNTWNKRVTTSGAPSTGVWVIGDFADNDSPSGGQPIVAYSCIAGGDFAGTPPVFVPLTALDMSGPITLANNKVLGFRNFANTGTLVGMLADTSDNLEIGAGGTLHKTVIKSAFALSANDVTAAAGEISFGNITGVGNGAATPVGTVLLGTGSGPASPGSIAGYLRINIGGTPAWIGWVL
jgi:hypothetical protein